MHELYEKQSMVCSASGEGTGEVIRSIACMLAEWVLKGASDEVGYTLSGLLDIFLVARGYFVDLVFDKVGSLILPHGF